MPSGQALPEERSERILCNSKKCCPLMTVIMVILAITAIVVVICVLVKKFNLLEKLESLEGRFASENESFVIEETGGDSDIPYTTDKDFV